jgi:pilus assembly protein Flp/PilA
MVKLIKSLLVDDSGASAAEYALILAIVGTGIAGAAWFLGTQIRTSINSAASCIPVTAGVQPSSGC